MIMYNLYRTSYNSSYSHLEIQTHGQNQKDSNMVDIYGFYKANFNVDFQALIVVILSRILEQGWRTKNCNAFSLVPRVDQGQ